MRIRCIGGPLDDTEVEVSDPPPCHLQAKWPSHSIATIIASSPSPIASNIPPTAVYQLEGWVTPLGERTWRYVCPQRHDPRGVDAPGYEPPRPPPPSWAELMAERDRLVAEFGDPRETPCLCTHGWADHRDNRDNACSGCECQRFRTDDDV